MDDSVMDGQRDRQMHEWLDVVMMEGRKDGCQVDGWMAGPQLSVPSC